MCSCFLLVGWVAHKMEDETETGGGERMGRRGTGTHVKQLLGVGMERVNTTGTGCGSVWLHVENANGQADVKLAAKVCGATGLVGSTLKRNSAVLSVGVKKFDVFQKWQQA